MSATCRNFTLVSFIRKSLAKKSGIRRYIGPKRSMLLLALVALIMWIWNLYGSGALNPGIIGRYRDDHPIMSIALFIAIYAVSVIALLPSLPLNLAGGFFWGGVLGGVYATVGLTIGGWASFAITRWLVGQVLAAQFDNKLMDRIQQEFERNGWKFVAFARIARITGFIVEYRIDGCGCLCQCSHYGHGETGRRR
jgi:uncharacterized membrane protein YdjX (TVP38/TMEM64 family)